MPRERKKDGFKNAPVSPGQVGQVASIPSSSIGDPTSTWVIIFRAIPIVRRWAIARVWTIFRVRAIVRTWTIFRVRNIVRMRTIAKLWVMTLSIPFVRVSAMVPVIVFRFITPHIETAVFILSPLLPLNLPLIF